MRARLKGKIKYEAFQVVKIFGWTPMWRGQPFEKRGTRRLCAPFGPQKILTAGRNYAGDHSDYLGHAQVGSGSTAPVAGDTGLESWVAGSSNVVSTTFGAQASAPFFGWKLITIRFAEGDAEGNLSEGGIGWADSGAALWCRHLIVDLVGDPTTITVLSNEWLDVSYLIENHPPTVDVEDTAVIDGETYDTITRAAEVTNADLWGDVIGGEMGKFSDSVDDWKAYDGDLGTVEQSPSGSSSNKDTSTVNNATYSNNSYERVMACPVGSPGWNIGAGIRSIRIKTTLGAYQTQYDNQVGGTRIPKTSGQTMNMEWTLAWEETP